MNISVFYRSATVWNIILFTLLIFFFLLFQEGLFQARSVFEVEFTKAVMLKYLPFNILLLSCAFGIFRLKRQAKFLFVVCSAVAVGFTALNLSENFSKLVVISLFLYILTAYYFYQFLRIEIGEAYYNPEYNRDDLFEPMLKRLDCEVEDLETGKVLKGRLTNWNPNGCFIFLDELQKESRLYKVRIKTTIAQRQFESDGSLTAKSSDGRGYGFRISDKKGTGFGWKEYQSIIEQMGYNVELLK